MANSIRKSQPRFGWEQVFKWIKEFTESASNPEDFGLQRVFSADSNIACDDKWGGRLLVLCDGRSVTEVIRILYREELANGAGLTDLGIWKSLFDRSVIQDINSLAQQGFLRVESVRHTDTVIKVKSNDRIGTTNAVQLDELLVRNKE